MKLPNIKHIRESSTEVLADNLGEMRQEFNETQEAHLIARSRLLVIDKIIDAVFNKADVAILGMNAQRTSDYPRDEIIAELDAMGYEHTTEADATNPNQKVLTIKLK